MVSTTRVSCYIQKVKNAQEAECPMPKRGYQSSRRVFSDEQEDAIASYLSTASDLYYGVSPKEARVLAFQCAVKFDIKFPEQWTSSQSAGVDWLYGFMSTHPSLSVRMPEATSLARATSVNTTTVGLFFEKLSTVIDKHKFEVNEIFNLDETLRKPSKSSEGMGSNRLVC